jgi:hypothetical protein
MVERGSSLYYSRAQKRHHNQLKNFVFPEAWIVKFPIPGQSFEFTSGSFFLGSFFNPEYGGSMFFRNVG